MLSLLHEEIVVCNCFLVFVAAAVGLFRSFAGKNGILPKKMPFF